MKKLLLLTILSFLIPLSFAQLYYQQNQPLDIKVPCLNNNTYCSDIAYCNMTIFYPNGSVLLNNENMTYSGAFFNYTITENQTKDLGEYQVTVICNDAGELGSSSFSYTITGNGKQEPSGIVYGLFILIFIVILFFLVIFLFHGMAHFKDLNFDLGGLAYNFGGYFALFGYYVLENAILGNEMIGNFIVTFLEIGAITNLLLPLILYLLSVTIGKQRALKMAEEKELE